MGKPQGNQRSHRPREEKEFAEEVIQIDRVTRVVKGGRRLRFRATVVVGNRRGRVGVGIGKSNEVTTAIKKAVAKAQKKMATIPITKNDSIPHEIQVKFKSANILLMPAGPGTGIIAGGAIRKVVELAGIKNILSKALGTNNRLANAQAALNALKELTEIPRLSKNFKKEDEEKAKKKEQHRDQETKDEETKDEGTKDEKSTEEREKTRTKTAKEKEAEQETTEDIKKKLINI